MMRSLFYSFKTLFILLILNIQVVFCAVTFTHQLDPTWVRIGECIAFNARTSFKGYSINTTIRWTKDSKPLENNNHVSIKDKRLYISYVTLQDGAHYSAMVSDTVNDVLETTDFWLNVNGCSSHETEDLTNDECETSCKAKCPIGWNYETFGGHCYKYFEDQKSWQEAQRSCTYMNGILATINSQRENRLIGSLIQTANGAWIGLNDRQNEEDFKWNYEEARLQTEAWAEGEPSNTNNDCNIEKCVMINGDSGQWSDIVCNMNLGFVCEKSDDQAVEENARDTWHCPSGFNKCLRHFNSPFYWSDALRKCHEINATIVKILTQTDNDLVSSLLSKKDNVWIGLNDQLEAGDYHWFQGIDRIELPSFYFNWKHNEPNDKHYGRDTEIGDNCPGEDCVQVIREGDGAVWHDKSCEMKLAYICQTSSDTFKISDVALSLIIGSLVFTAAVFICWRAALRRKSRNQIRAMVQRTHANTIRSCATEKRSFRKLVQGRT